MIVMKIRQFVVALFLCAAPVAWAEDPVSGMAVDPKVDEILTRLERSRDGLTDLKCKVRLFVDDKLELTSQTKEGSLQFLISDPNPLFMIHFEKTVTDGIVKKREWYLFDGQWLHEAVERLAQVTKREIARPGQKVDFFDLESAPFPLPFGQKKETILRNFDVTLVPSKEGDPADSDHLSCKPKPFSSLRDRYEQLEFFVLRSVDLPGRIVVTKNRGREVSTADFSDLGKNSINAGLSNKDFALPGDCKEYKVVIEEMADENETPKNPKAEKSKPD